LPGDGVARYKNVPLRADKPSTGRLSTGSAGILGARMFKRFKIERRLLVDSTLFGVMLTLLVAAADAFGLLSPLERWFYDQRAAHCQHWMPRPTDRLVHLDIDDAALESVGRWPWRRGVLAEMLDEVAAAQPKAVALDLLLSEPQEKQLVKHENEEPQEIDHDDLLASSIWQLDMAVVAARLPFQGEPVTPAYVAMRDLLSKDPTIEQAAMAPALRGLGIPAAQAAEAAESSFFRARRDALFRRIAAEPESVLPDELRKDLLPGIPDDVASPALHAFEEQVGRVQAVREFQQFALPPQPRTAPIFSSHLGDVPIAPFSHAAAAGGFVDYLQGSDGKVRSGPLFIESSGRVYPQFGVALALKFLGVDPAAVRIAANEVIIPRRGAPDLRIPVRTVPARELYQTDSDVPLAADITWFGGADWTRMYDPDPSVLEKRQHVSLGVIWDICLARRNIIRNNKWAADDVAELLKEKLPKQRPAGDDPQAWLPQIDAALRAAEARGGADEELSAAIERLRTIREENPKLARQLRMQRDALRAQLEGRAVLIGWTATASIADFLPTSLHPRCPGVVLHGVMFNQIVTGELWRTLPPWATLLTTLALGLLTTVAVSFLSPAKAVAAVAALAVGYLAINGWMLFDRNNLILGAAGPTVAIAAVWSGGTLAKLGMERYERTRITRRFRSYADPKLVDYVLKHPEQNLFEGQVRELTVVYVDLVGFTKLTEAMGPEAVQLLNELWSTLIPVIKRNDAYVNKFLGDGMMFFYGAPEQSPHHARDAVNTVLAVGKALEEFNGRAAQNKWPRQALRFGISTGNMVVGDAGAPREERTDYTVIGDYANLGARLESANKAVGTVALMTDRTVELAGEGFLFRPIGKLCVVGKQTGVMTYEVLARLDEATKDQKQLAADTKDMVEAFLAGRLPECVAAIERLEAAHGTGKLTALYRERCNYYLTDPSHAPFDCQIVLTEK
jgi:CHASE2 domain-containing sensor protein/class 3 adenylate cyclase